MYVFILYTTHVLAEIILTAGKRDGRAVVRLDRHHATEIAGAKIHQVTTGQYKGLLINKKKPSILS